MKLKKKEQTSLLRNTLTNVLEKKIIQGTEVFFTNIKIKNSDWDSRSLAEFLEERLSWDVEEIAFMCIEFTRKGKNSEAMLIFGINSITGSFKGLVSDLKLSVAFISLLGIESDKLISLNLGNLEKVVNKIIGNDIRLSNFIYYITDHRDTANHLYNFCEYTGIRHRIQRIERDNVSLPFLKEQNEFNEKSFINLINCYLVLNDLARCGNSLFKKIQGSVSSWEYFDTIDYIEDNIELLFEFLKKKRPIQMGLFDPTQLILYWASNSFMLIKKDPFLLRSITLNRRYIELSDGYYDVSSKVFFFSKKELKVADKYIPIEIMEFNKNKSQYLL